MVRASNHVVLPWDSSGRRVVVSLQVETLKFGCLCGIAAPCNEVFKVRQDGIASPYPRDNFMCVWIFTIQYSILSCWISEMHEVMETATGQYYGCQYRMSVGHSILADSKNRYTGRRNSKKP